MGLPRFRKDQEAMRQHLGRPARFVFVTLAALVVCEASASAQGFFHGPYGYGVSTYGYGFGGAGVGYGFGGAGFGYGFAGPGLS